jgi:hypothetical protein
MELDILLRVFAASKKEVARMSCDKEEEERCKEEVLAGAKRIVYLLALGLLKEEIIGLDQAENMVLAVDGNPTTLEKDLSNRHYFRNL